MDETELEEFDWFKTDIGAKFSEFSLVISCVDSPKSKLKKPRAPKKSLVCADS